MEIIKEKVDKEFFIDIIVSNHDIEEISRGSMVSVEFYLEKETVYLGVRKPIPGEENAAKTR